MGEDNFYEEQNRGSGDVAQFVQPLPGIHKAPDSTPSITETSKSPLLFHSYEASNV